MSLCFLWQKSRLSKAWRQESAAQVGALLELSTHLGMAFNKGKMKN